MFNVTQQCQFKGLMMKPKTKEDKKDYFLVPSSTEDKYSHQDLNELAELIAKQSKDCEKLYSEVSSAYAEAISAHNEAMADKLKNPMTTVANSLFKQLATRFINTYDLNLNRGHSYQIDFLDRIRAHIRTAVANSHDEAKLKQAFTILERLESFDRSRQSYAYMTRINIENIKIKSEILTLTHNNDEQKKDQLPRP